MRRWENMFPPLFTLARDAAIGDSPYSIFCDMATLLLSHGYNIRMFLERQARFRRMKSRKIAPWHNR